MMIICYNKEEIATNRNMRTAYQFRLKPTYLQRCIMSRWLNLLRWQYNGLLADRFDWWEHNRTSINACPLVASIA